MKFSLSDIDTLSQQKTMDKRRDLMHESWRKRLVNNTPTAFILPINNLVPDNLLDLHLNGNHQPIPPQLILHFQLFSHTSLAIWGIIVSSRCCACTSAGSGWQNYRWCHLQENAPDTSRYVSGAPAMRTMKAMNTWWSGWEGGYWFHRSQSKGSE